MNPSSGRCGLRQAVLASLCSLALLSAPPVAVFARAQEAASAVQDVALQDVVLSFGDTKVTAPRLTASGTRLSKDELLAILKADGKEPWSARLARLEAGSLVIPELRLEQSGGGTSQTVVYRDVVARGVHSGRITDLTSSGAMIAAVSDAAGTSPKGEGSYGKIRVEDIDLAALTRLSLEPGDAKGALQRVYAGVSVDTVSFHDERGTTIDVAHLVGRDLSGRQVPGAWNGAVAAVRALDPSSGDPATRAKAAGTVADLIEGVAAGSLEATGLRMKSVKDGKTFELTIGRAGYAATGPDAGIALGDVSVGGLGSGTRSTIAKLSLKGLSLAPTVATLRRLSTSADANSAAADDMRRLTPEIGTVTLSGLGLDLPVTDGKPAASAGDPMAKPSTGPLHVGLREATMTFGPPKDGVPTTSRLSLSGLTMPASTVAGLPGLGSMGLYGYRDLDLDVLADSSWNEDAKQLDLRDVSLTGKDMGTLRIAGALGGIGPEIFDPDAATAGLAMLSATAKTLEVKVQNGGLYDRFIDATAKSLSLKPDELRKEYVTACLIGIPVILGNSPAAKAIGAAMGKFAAKPGTLLISAKAKSDAGLGVADFTTATSPGALLDKLEVNASAE